jgi:5,5'-dehydrodivanillate O-demethylase
VLESSYYVRHCNYFQNIENEIDEVHVGFVHRDSRFTDSGLNFDLPRITAEETPWGLAQLGTRANGVVRVSHLLMPNILYSKGSPNDSGSGWREQLAWRVPIDDERHRNYNVSLAHLEGDAAVAYQERQRQRWAQLAGQPSANEVAAAIRRGELSMQSVLDRPDIVNIQDHVVLEGQGVIADRTNERLGRSDVAVILLRKLWTRELQRLAAGKPLKAWSRPAQLEVTVGL